jgi:MoaA/NifB/PqqE/SkfB family radical SAM enzyme
MNFKIAQRAISLFLNFQKNSQKQEKVLIRFFGGEPLLNFEIVKKTVDYIKKKKYQKINFDLTTNGSLLNRKILDFFRLEKNFELIISTNQSFPFLNKKILKKILEIPKTTINFNLSPSTVTLASKNFRMLVNLGFRRFNFLPTYYIFWKKEKLFQLKKNLEEISKIIFSLPKKIYVKNLKINSPIPLFNIAPTIDTQGDVYLGNFILDKRFHFLKKELKIGNIFEINCWEDLFDLPFNYDFQELIKRVFPRKILHNTFLVDKILTDFCDKIKKYYEKT